MSNIDLSQQILNKINSSNQSQFKTINDIDKGSGYNVLQYAIFLTKYGDMHNLNEEEYLFLLSNINFTVRPIYEPRVTMSLIFGVGQNQKLSFSVDFLEKLHSFHNTSALFTMLSRPSLKLMLTRSLLDFPDIEVESWLWLVKKNMIEDSALEASGDGVKKYLLAFCNKNLRSLSFSYEENMRYAKKSIDYLTSITDQKNLDDSISTLVINTRALEAPKKVTKI